MRSHTNLESVSLYLFQRAVVSAIKRIVSIYIQTSVYCKLMDYFECKALPLRLQCLCINSPITSIYYFSLLLSQYILKSIFEITSTLIFPHQFIFFLYVIWIFRSLWIKFKMNKRNNSIDCGSIRNWKNCGKSENCSLKRWKTDGKIRSNKSLLVLQSCAAILHASLTHFSMFYNDEQKTMKHWSMLWEFQTFFL
jgi:hypothetical protein